MSRLFALRTTPFTNDGIADDDIESCSQWNAVLWPIKYISMHDALSSSTLSY